MQSIELTWRGGEHSFALPLGQLRALQQCCDAGPAWVLARLTNQQWRVEDVYDTIRLGLEGGGMDKQAARKLADQHLDGALAMSVLTAQTILLSAIYDDKDDPVGEAEGEAENNPTSPTESGGSPGSTAGAP